MDMEKEGLATGQGYLRLAMALWIFCDTLGRQGTLFLECVSIHTEIFKAYIILAAIWAVFLGFDIHAFRPRRGVGQDQGVPVDQLNDLFGPEDEDDGAFAGQGGHDIPENLQLGLVPQLDPNDILFPVQPGLEHFAPGGGAEQDAAMDPDELFFGDGRVQQRQPDLGPFEHFEQERDVFEEEQLPVVDSKFSGSFGSNISLTLWKQGEDWCRVFLRQDCITTHLLCHVVAADYGVYSLCIGQ
jgi:hypothetical protein